MTVAYTRAAVLLSALSLCACSSAAMEVPAELAPVERVAVEGRGGWRTPKRIAFGDYEAEGIRRSSTRSRGSGGGIGRVGGGKTASRQGYGYAYQAGGSAQGRVACEATSSATTINLPLVDVEAASGAGLQCRLTDADGVAPWELVLLSRRDRHLTGFISAGESRFEVAGTGPGGGGVVPAIRRGFEVRRDGIVVAAVETVGSGAVWLAPDLPPAERTVLAGAALALLLYQDLPPAD